MKENRKRIGFIDALRGIAILSIVYHHLIVMGMRDTGYNSSINALIRIYALPLFFFVSGFLFDKPLGEYNMWHILKDKFMQLVIPAVVMFIFCIEFFQLSFVQYLLDSYKCGYWFTWTLFCMMVIHILYKETLGKNKSGGAIYAFLVLFLHYIGHHYSESIGFSYLSLDLTFEYYPFFMIGTVLKASKNRCWLQNVWFIQGMLFVSIFALVYDKTIPWYFFTCIRFCMLFCICFIWIYFRDYWDSESTVAICLRTFGKNSMAIYFLHYFLLFKIDFMVELLKSLQDDYCFRGHSCDWLLELMLVGCMTLLVVFASLLIKKLLEPFRIISKFCFGK